MDSELLESLCASLSISDCDGPVKVLDGKLMDEVVHRMSLCMSFYNALIALEKPDGKGTIDSLRFDQADFWVQIHQVPLLCMTREIGRFLGGMVGLVLEVDGRASRVCVGKFMRVRVRVDIKKPLKRCLQVDILGDGTETLWSSSMRGFRTIVSDVE
ncbi:hypothetical protein Dsin_012706 [Dipteronia sinensis]|uniref:DUF4283 domain-containing protein n=1 Tax=Dipteronia sinensis TaxID=43782 RepID=A0AAE0E8A6_9ROSI|nr:hypothetical protein Dsin_012706 [Dipteronia sinensis]